jgi:hypothetical protein
VNVNKSQHYHHVRFNLNKRQSIIMTNSVGLFLEEMAVIMHASIKQTYELKRNNFSLNIKLSIQMIETEYFSYKKSYLFLE